MTHHAPTKIYMNPRRDNACIVRRTTKYLMIYFQNIPDITEVSGRMF